jgi:hypothetical protein
MSTDYVALHGMPTCGDPIYDKGTANELVTRMLTINQIAEFYKNGVTVEVVKYSDTKVIYELIVDHLSSWKQKMATSFHTKNAPLEDLILLDKLASVVYKFAQPQFTTEVVDSLIARRMSSALKHTKENILAKPKPTVINPIEDAPAIPQRETMADSFIKHKNGNGRPWR